MRERDSGFVRLRESLRLCIQLNCRAEKAVNLNPFLVRFIAAQSKSAFLHRSPSEILFCFNKNANFMYFCECFCCCWFLFHFSCRFYWFFSYFSWWLHFKMYVDEFDWICCCKIQMYTAMRRCELWIIHRFTTCLKFHPLSSVIDIFIFCLFFVVLKKKKRVLHNYINIS